MAREITITEAKTTTTTAPRVAAAAKTPAANNLSNSSHRSNGSPSSGSSHQHNGLPIHTLNGHCHRVHIPRLHGSPEFRNSLQVFWVLVPNMLTQCKLLPLRVMLLLTWMLLCILSLFNNRMWIGTLTPVQHPTWLQIQVLLRLITIWAIIREFLLVMGILCQLKVVVMPIQWKFPFLPYHHYRIVERTKNFPFCHFFYSYFFFSIVFTGYENLK